jgi:3'(2'), 5'-bisphosphate nucleotidase
VTDHDIAAQLAKEAGELLVELRDRRTAEGISGKELGREGDAFSHELLMKRLAEQRPDDAVLSEEGADDAARLAVSRVWIVDPLDGTREYGEPPRSDWAVHVALAVDGEAKVGAVALPGRDLVMTSLPGHRLADPPGGPDGRIRVVVSRSRPPKTAEAVARAVDGDLVGLGSAGAKAMAVVLGEADVYVHSGGQYEWDSAAPVAVAQAAGLHASRLDGSPLVYNQPDPYLPDLVICHPQLAATVLATVAEAGDAPTS